MARLRKLLSYSTLKAIHDRHTLGVPVTKLLEHYKPQCSVPVLTSLINHYEDYAKYIELKETTVATTIFDSLFPDWLLNEVTIVQEEPETYTYSGRFPVGAWVKNENN